MNKILNSGEAAQADPGFRALSALAYRQAGLVLSSSKASTIKSRLRHRLKALALEGLEEYCDYVTHGGDEAEWRHMISALTTNVSGFFREPHHFDQLARELVPDMIRRLRAGQPVRIWSAGCANGQEPYSIAMMLLEHDAIFRNGDFRILGTDIDPMVVQFARTGTYDAAQVEGLSPERLKRFAVKSDCETSAERYTVVPKLQQMVVFKELNLTGAWPMKGSFDCIFCRNVVIYFDSETQDRLWPRFCGLLRPDGIVFVGHSERIVAPCFKPAGATAYRKVARPDAENRTPRQSKDG